MPRLILRSRKLSKPRKKQADNFNSGLWDFAIFCYKTSHVLLKQLICRKRFGEITFGMLQIFVFNTEHRELLCSLWLLRTTNLALEELSVFSEQTLKCGNRRRATGMTRDLFLLKINKKQKSRTVFHIASLKISLFANKQQMFNL